MRLSERQKIAYVLVNTPGVGYVTGRNLLEGAVADTLDGFIVSVRGKCSNREYAELVSTAHNADFASLERKLENKKITPVSILDEEYPDSLKPYADMPLLLYAKGDLSLLKADSFAVVGTRRPTRYGLRVTEDFTTKLSERFCIVSGMARGIDACAHRAALNAGGKTIAVLGSGVDVVYPPENYALYRDIAEYGLIISEYEPGIAPSAHNFPARNRLISGLSRSVLVTEAGLKSGTMLTINYAVKQGKDIFCVPGNIYSSTSSGCNRSIKECQSRVALDVNDIYEELGLSKTNIEKPHAVQLDFNEELILKSLEKNGEMHFDELLEEVDVSVSQLSTLLIKLEAVGLINKTKFNYWSV